MQIIDNFLEPDVFDPIARVAEHEKTDWHLSRNVSSPDSNDGVYLTRNVYSDHVISCNSFTYIVENVISKIEDCQHIIRIRYVMYLQSDKIVEHKRHVDFPFPTKGALLYLNTNNGFTRLNDGTKVDSVANRLLLHDASEMHNSSTCTDAKTRAVLVCNYI